MESLRHFFGVALVIEREKPIEDFDAGLLTDRIAHALFCLMESVPKVEVAPTVGCCYSVSPFRRGGGGVR